MSEIKPQTFGVYQRTGLFDVIAQYRFERGLQNMRAGMIGGNRFSVFFIHNQPRLIANFYLPFLHNASMNNKIFQGFFCFLNFEIKTIAFKITGISHLTTGLAVKRSFIESQFRVLPLGYCLHRISVHKYRRNF